MANEVNVSVSLSYKKNGVSTIREESFKADVAGDSMEHAIQSIGTTHEVLQEAADLGAPGWVFLKNLDPTNYVEFGFADEQFTIKLLPGESTVFRWSESGNITAQANTGACLVEFLIIET